MSISTNQKPAIYRNLYENTGPDSFIQTDLCFQVLSDSVFVSASLSVRWVSKLVSWFPSFKSSQTLSWEWSDSSCGKCNTAVQSQNAATAYFASKQLLPSGFAEQSGVLLIQHLWHKNVVVLLHNVTYIICDIIIPALPNVTLDTLLAFIWFDDNYIMGRWGLLFRLYVDACFRCIVRPAPPPLIVLVSVSN